MAVGENPVGEVNLNKNAAYNNALKCLENPNKECPPGTLLNETGILYVGANKSAVCTVECKNQTMIELNCMEETLNDFRFNNNAQINDVRLAIVTGCVTGNFTVIPTSVATSIIAPSFGLATLLAIACLITSMV